MKKLKKIKVETEYRSGNFRELLLEEVETRYNKDKYYRVYCGVFLIGRLRKFKDENRWHYKERNIHRKEYWKYEDDARTRKEALETLFYRYKYCLRMEIIRQRERLEERKRKEQQAFEYTKKAILTFLYEPYTAEILQDESMDQARVGEAMKRLLPHALHNAKIDLIKARARKAKDEYVKILEELEEERRKWDEELSGLG